MELLHELVEDEDDHACYVQRWPTLPISIHPFRPDSIIVALMAVPHEQVIFPTDALFNVQAYDGENQQMLVVSKFGTLTAFSPPTWTNIMWKVKLVRPLNVLKRTRASRPGFPNFEIYHAVYNPHADCIYFSSLQDSAIYVIFRRTVIRGADREVPLESFLETSKPIKGLHFDSDKGLLFACENLGKINIWLLKQSGSITLPIDLGKLELIQSPCFISSFFDPSRYLYQLAISSDLQGVVLLMGSSIQLDAFCDISKPPIFRSIDLIFRVRNVLAQTYFHRSKELGKVSDPQELQFDRHGNLVVTDSLNERIQFFCGQDSENLVNSPSRRPHQHHVVWASDSCTNTSSRLLVINDKSNESIIIVGKGVSGIEFYSNA